MNSRIIEDAAFNLIKTSAINLPQDVKQMLKKAYAEETSLVGKTQLKAILDNIELAEFNHVPLCQDTGTITFYVKAGSKVRNLDKVEEALVNATRKATREIPLRPNAVNPLNEKNSDDNTGRLMPIIHWELFHGTQLELTVATKGGGSENASALAMLNPSNGIKELKKFVIDSIIRAGAKPCPPTILGIGVGGGADVAIELAKKALLRPLDEMNPDPTVANLEREILDAANMTGIGPMGLGGKTTVLGVHFDYAYRHPASFPVAVAFSCWADRRASARISGGGDVKFIGRKESG